MLDACYKSTDPACGSPPYESTDLAPKKKKNIHIHIHIHMSHTHTHTHTYIYIILHMCGGGDDASKKFHPHPPHDRKLPRPWSEVMPGGALPGWTFGPHGRNFRSWGKVQARTPPPSWGAWSAAKMGIPRRSGARFFMEMEINGRGPRAGPFWENKNKGACARAGPFS